MKTYIKTIIIKILSLEALLILRKYKPNIVGVTGSVGKTSTKDAVALVLSSKYRVRKSEKSYNSDLGVPLTILGEKSGWNNPFDWAMVIIKGFLLIISQNDYPEWLVLEMGAGRPNEIKDNVRWINFDIAVLTSLPDVPVHIEMFGSRERLIEEKLALIKSVGKNGYSILCSDDQSASQAGRDLVSKVLTYGQGTESLVRATRLAVSYRLEDAVKQPIGISFNINYLGKEYPVILPNIVGSHMVYPILAAFAAGVATGISPEMIVTKLPEFITPPGRQRLVKGINNSMIIDDTYNSSPIAMSAALNSLEAIETTGRKIAVIGNMMELGSHTAPEHRKIGLQAAKFCDLILTVGIRASFAKEAALAAGFAPEKMSHFEDSVSAGDYLKSQITANDIVLVKGSQSARMEKVVEKIMAEPGRKKELLVRQEEEWLT